MKTMNLRKLKMKKVTYLDVEYFVRDWVNWMAFDEDKSLYVFENKPYLSNEVPFEQNFLPMEGKFHFVCDIDPDETIWSESLREIK